MDPFLNKKNGIEYKIGEFIGGYVLPDHAEYLRLLSIYENTSTQAIIQMMIEELKARSDTEETIVEVLADRAYQEWNHRLKKDSSLKFKTYRNEMKDRLRKRKLTDQTIKKILTRTNDRRKVQER